MEIDIKEEHLRKLNVKKYAKTLDENYRLFLPPYLIDNKRYTLNNLWVSFGVDGYFRIGYLMRDNLTTFVSEGGVDLEYSVAENFYYQLNAPKV